MIIIHNESILTDRFALHLVGLVMQERNKAKADQYAASTIGYGGEVRYFRNKEYDSFFVRDHEGKET